MTRDDYTHISFVLDRSGSMSSIAEATCSAFNEFLGEQRRAEGKTTLSLTLFNTAYDHRHDVAPIGEVEELKAWESYVPEGMTALHDAVGATIVATGRTLDAIPEAERPARVLFVIQTDGHENSSQEYAGEPGRQQVLRLREHQEQRYGWTFMFLGANQNAWDNPFGIDARNTVSYDADEEGARLAAVSTADSAAAYRKMRGGQSATLSSAPRDLRKGKGRSN